MGKDGQPAAKGQGKVVTDARFAAVHHDPRFQRFPRAKAKVEIDERFAGMFKDAAFEVRSSAVDKRGRKVKSGKKNEDMRRYYRIRNEEEGEHAAQEQQQQVAGEDEDGHNQQAAAAGAPQQPRGDDQRRGAGSAGRKSKRQQAAPQADGSGSQAESDSEPAGNGLGDEERAAQERWARMRGLAGPETSDEEEDEEEGEGSSSAEESEEQEEDFRVRPRLTGGPDEEGEEDEVQVAVTEADLQEWGVGALAANPEEEIPLLPDATCRLAAVDLDWEHVRAVDILAVLRSFVPKGGAITRVVVYPSDYGLDRMAQEAVMGPRGIFKPAAASAGASGKQGSDSEEEEAADGVAAAEEEEEESESGEEGSAVSGSDSEEGDEVDQHRLRMYERSKLRYYYAVVTCDSPGTANRLYDECDGMELMKTACKFDLRFVPEEQSFEGRKVRDEASEVPADYAPPNFQARALQHTSVQLTWDADDDGRKRALTHRPNAEELKEDDFRAYLASDSEGRSGSEDGVGEGEGGEEEDEAAIRERYRSLLLGGGDAGAMQERQGKKDWGNSSGEGESSSDDEAEAAGKARVKDDKGMEMEVTFLPGLENLGERLLAKKREEEARKGETVWDAYLRRRREKRAEAKRKGRQLASDESDSDYDGNGGGGSESGSEGEGRDPFFQQEADPFDDPFFKDGPGADAAEAAELAAGGKHGKAQQQASLAEKKGRGKKGKVDAADTSKRAELEMLLMDDAALQAAARGGNAASASAPAGKQQAGAAPAPKLSKKERMRLKKEAKRRERLEGSDDEDAAAGGGSFRGADLSDPRFSGLLTSHHFALDPTDPRFKDTSLNVAAAVAKKRSQVAAASDRKQRQQQQQQQQGQQEAEGTAGQGQGVGQQQNGSATASAAAQGKADLSFLVASLKRKSAGAHGGSAQPAAGAPAGTAANGEQKKRKKRQRV
ncbi:hypothetical protein D9Q98_001049 [Chlorella vulgaris]|uniref:NUC153 domain-containing protein n=1 Tax=Chlorella vulgaris TaxID=3077 RepID=A0A9D4TZH1_CHLVU|nr:hypothetical protein D9Q98_001049 [Chlorella vulgaris]